MKNNMKRFVKDLRSALDRNIVENTIWKIVLHELDKGECTAVRYKENGQDMVELVYLDGTKDNLILPKLEW